MKEKILKRKLKKEIKLLKEQSPIRRSQNDPATSCAGRGECCEDRRTKKITAAKFILKPNKRVVCKCPRNSNRKICEY